MPHWKFNIQLLCLLQAKLRYIRDGRIDIREAAFEKTLLAGHVELVAAELVADGLAAVAAICMLSDDEDFGRSADLACVLEPLGDGGGVVGDGCVDSLLHFKASSHSMFLLVTRLHFTSMLHFSSRLYFNYQVSMEECPCPVAFQDVVSSPHRPG